jgi:hypothetical protein
MDHAEVLDFETQTLLQMKLGTDALNFVGMFKKNFTAFFYPVLESNVTAHEVAPIQSLEELWDEVGPQISAVLQNDGVIPNDIVPFDAASDRDMDEQK